MGICDRTTGTCECREGFEGIACERQSCPAQCNGVGECQSMYYYALSKDPGSGDVYSYDTRWDAHKIYGCNCDSKYYGIDCSLRWCPNGDDPLTGTNQISDTNPMQFNEIQRVTCKADDGTFTLTYKGKTTDRIPYNAKAAELQEYIEALPTVGSGNIKIVMTGGQACTESGTSWTVEFLQNFGALPLMVPDQRQLVYANALTSSILAVTTLVLGTKENAQCSDRGICDTSVGVCTCSDFFDTSNGYNTPGTRGDCGYATQTIEFCPGSISCSAHGQCLNNPTYRCECSDGWTGADCSERLCPTGLAWFALPEDTDLAHITTYAECSNAGICDRSSGQCACQTGFTGAACDRLACPGASAETAGCSGHGQCLDMNALASLATVNGDLGNFTYGDVPNSPSTWDANRIYGCLCDAEYEGYDCSLLVCPHGDDPDTYHQTDEQQIISCTDSDLVGNIVLTFRQHSTSVTLSPTSTTAEVAAALNALESIGEVTVETYVDGADDSLCLVTGNQLIITFLTEHGDLPMLQYAVENVDTLEITQYSAGDKENQNALGAACAITQLENVLVFPVTGLLMERAGKETTETADT
eukprot:CAMPEP_0175005256 /NCGR_PEP_ID=MMETSP0005-20121125/5212_1 /TAXON_ID=420556 /ORGANISM="Ochromonas sp., Strain CCMP1393" /LENGTH=585 /DNA_ID=CAMNT_0016260481 /DNA_START=285 /DNA_END=2043 /DNA_ORIENTATION=+